MATILEHLNELLSESAGKKFKFKPFITYLKEQAKLGGGKYVFHFGGGEYKFDGKELSGPHNHNWRPAAERRHFSAELANFKAVYAALKPIYEYYGEKVFLRAVFDAFSNIYTKGISDDKNKVTDIISNGELDEYIDRNVSDEWNDDKWLAGGKLNDAYKEMMDELGWSY